MKIAVYAICKNEEKHIERWVRSMSEADALYVTDTGSTDHSVTLLKSVGVNVQVFEQDEFRFDTARNQSLKFVPEHYDYCVCTDLDEVFTQGWRSALEQTLKLHAYADRVLYKFVTTINADGSDGTMFYNYKIHKRKGFEWKYPVHEALLAVYPIREVTCHGFTLYHHPDREKPRDYLSLLETAVREDTSPRNLHYLCREYYYVGLWDKCIDVGIQHINAPDGWYEEYAATMRYVGVAYKEAGNLALAERWLMRSIEHTPNRREPYIEIAILFAKMKKPLLAKWAIAQAETIQERYGNYIHEDWAWNHEVFTRH
jgi:glycosyltransferase involved in cell wall biosynthesis